MRKLRAQMKLRLQRWCVTYLLQTFSIRILMVRRKTLLAWTYSCPNSVTKEASRRAPCCPAVSNLPALPSGRKPELDLP